MPLFQPKHQLKFQSKSRAKNQSKPYAYGLSALLIISLLAGCSDEPEAIAPEKPVAKVDAQPNVMPALNLDILSNGNSASAIDYIIDGSSSMCGYFNAELNTTEQAIPITKLIQAIQAVLRSDDRLLIFMQGESADKATYLPFETFENQLMQGSCDLGGQYTELGLILRDYREDPELQQRSVAIVSDMHFLPAERTGFESQYDAFLNAYVNAQSSAQNNAESNTETNAKNSAENSEANLSNGILSMRAPFVGTYYTVNNETKAIAQIQKHLHFFWLAKQASSAEQIEKIQQNLIDAQNQYPNSVIAQAEFLPQLKLLTDGAKSYNAFSSPAPVISPKNLIDLSMNEQKPFISGFEANSVLSAEQKDCYDVSWDNKDSLVFYPYISPKTNRDKVCADGPLFRSKTGSTLRLNLPLQTGYSITPKAPAAVEVVNNYLSIPIVEAQKSCIGVSSGMAEAQKTAQGVQLQYTAKNIPIDTNYYAQYSIERDGCSSTDDCSNLSDKTFQYNQLISSLANKSKQHIDSLYPRTININLICDPSL